MTTTYYAVMDCCEAYGSVEGTVETINFHSKNRYFNLYDTLDGHRIKCSFGQRIDFDLVRDSLLRRVLVSGEVSYRGPGNPSAVQVQNLMIFPDEDRLPTIEAVRGILG